ncbi:BZ3500_MvSof-1268-A1-R1_Chr1-2g01441 [Microbotryum saponariae]|uniref:BZ3500_MvSof-1268-A1-R1_Chr1-2g01441 protein n=1 Tax=Microbotryum saponariae TaxID=289078 RepID=A0A2X0KKA8_9BASI|nr:BZ3500_MvSof-1268-A1-R1_Chr1-2g01441 [Microbotryum saponariae]SCZ97446.1 BZ3501_MvSof-1269-A2-R1_Chr1-2g01040 [Microbotryum saponariae]
MFIMTDILKAETIQRPRSSPAGARRRDVLLPPPQVKAPSPTSEPSSPTVTLGGRRRARSSTTPREIEHGLCPSTSPAVGTEESIAASGLHRSNSEDLFSVRINPTGAPVHPIPSPTITTGHPHYPVHEYALEQDYSSHQYHVGYDPSHHYHPHVTSPMVVPYRSSPNGSIASLPHRHASTTASDHHSGVAIANVDDSSHSPTMIILHGGVPQQAFPSPQSSPGIAMQDTSGWPPVPGQAETGAPNLSAPPRSPFFDCPPPSVYHLSPNYQSTSGPIEFIPRPYPCMSPNPYPPFHLPPMGVGFSHGPPIQDGQCAVGGRMGPSVLPRLEGGEVFYERSGVVKFWNMKGWGYLVDDHAYELDGRDVFVHHTAIRQTGGFFRFLVPHERAIFTTLQVTYDLLYKEKKPHRPIGNGSSEEDHEQGDRNTRPSRRLVARLEDVNIRPEKGWSTNDNGNGEPERGLAAQNVRDGNGQFSISSTPLGSKVGEVMLISTPFLMITGMNFWHCEREPLFDELGLASRLPKNSKKDTFAGLKTTTTRSTAHSALPGQAGEAGVGGGDKVKGVH